MRRAAFFTLTLILAAPPAHPSAQQASAPAPALTATNHPQLPADLSEFWMVPASGAAAAGSQADLATAVKLIADAKHEAALAILSRPALQNGPLARYVTYYTGIAQLSLARPADALRTFQRLDVDAPVGFLSEAGALREGESDEALGNNAAAAERYERLSTTKTTAPDDVLMRLGRAAKLAGDRQKAADAFSRVYFEYPTSDLAALAGAELETLPPAAAATSDITRDSLALKRAERLYSSRSYAQARSAFDALRKSASSGDRDLMNLRVAECDFALKRARLARDGVKPYVDKGARKSEALYFYALTQRDLGLRDAFVQNIQKLSHDFPNDVWTEEGLNALASYYIVHDEDDSADQTLRAMYSVFPRGRFAERAAWKVGWTAYKAGQFADAAGFFEGAAANFPRSDYRPPWLYWAGRAHDALKNTDVAQARYTLLVADYANTYYGRLGAPRLTASQRQSPASLRAQLVPAPPAPPPPNRAVIRALLALDLYDQALNELRYAQAAWGDSPSIQATMGFIYNRKGDFRAGINAVKRGYPQYMTAGGENLPRELLKLVYPLDFWPSIRQYSADNGLDPYLVAALVLQESNFDPGVRSPANAYGLMQLLPSTGRSYALRLKLTNRFTVSLLKKADANLRMGTAYFADLMKQFGGTYFALASYNAGESRVMKWRANAPDAPRDEFVEDIPFPETANYVKRILGTMEDYRRLYPEGAVNDGDNGDALHAVAHPSVATGLKKAAASRAPAAKKPAAKKPAPARRTVPSKKTS